MVRCFSGGDDVLDELRSEALTTVSSVSQPTSFVSDRVRRAGEKGGGRETDGRTPRVMT